MTEPERPHGTFYAFCSLILPGLGQLLQKRAGAAVGFFVLFILTGFLPVLIVSLLFRDRFTDQPLRVHFLHLSVFGGLYFLFLLAIFWSVMDAARKPEVKSEEKSEAGAKPKRRFPLNLGGLFAAIGVVGVLIALLLPAVPSAGEAARRMQCSNNLKQLMLAFHTYHDACGQLPPAYSVDENGHPLHSWRVLILPFIEQRALYEEIRLDEPWDSEHNQQFHSKIPSTYWCPSNPNAPTRGGCCYSIICGEEAAFAGAKPRKFKDITDGTSNTIFLVERKVPVNWMDPSNEITFETACEGVNVNAMGISSFHTEGANYALGDGSVSFISNTIDAKELRKMLTISEGQE